MNVNKLSLSVVTALAILSAPAYAITGSEPVVGATTTEVTETYVISDAEHQQIKAYYDEHKTDSLPNLVTGMIAAFPQIPGDLLVAELLALVPRLPGADVVVVGLIDLFPNVSVDRIVTVVLNSMPGNEQLVIQAAMLAAPAEAPTIARAALDAGMAAEDITAIAVGIPTVDIAAVAVAMETQTAAGTAAPAAGDTTTARASFSGRGSGVSPSN